MRPLLKHWKPLALAYVTSFLLEQILQGSELPNEVSLLSLIFVLLMMRQLLSRLILVVAVGPAAVLDEDALADTHH